MVKEWLGQVQSTEMCMNLVFSLIAPQLYRHGLISILELQAKPEKYFKIAKTLQGAVTKPWQAKLEALQPWPSIFSGVSIIANRITPSHRDDNGHHPWFDLLFSAGQHEAAILKVPELKGHFSYLPGTLVALCGKVLRHEVPSYKGSDRLCIAHYFRPDALARMRLNSAEPNWVECSTIMGTVFNRDWVERNSSLYNIPVQL